MLFDIGRLICDRSKVEFAGNRVDYNLESVLDPFATVLMFKSERSLNLFYGASRVIMADRRVHQYDV